MTPIWVTVVAFLAGAATVYALLVRPINPLLRALERAQSRMTHARWLIYRDWAEADALLGMGERDIARVLHQSRMDVKPDVDPPSSEQLMMFIEAHRSEFPRETYE